MAGEVQAADEWRRGWPVVLASTIGFGTGTMHVFFLGLMMEPLQAAYGWSRTEIAAGMTIVSVLTVVAAPGVGLLIDRLGARRIATPGLALYCGGVALLSAASASVWTWWGIWALIACGAVLIKATIWTAAVASRFERSRGLAFAFTLSGAGLCASLMPVVANGLTQSFGWRGAMLGLGAGAAAIALPLALLFFRDSHDVATARSAAARQKADRSQVPGVGIRAGFLSRPFAHLAVTTVAFATGMSAMIVHFVPILDSLGLERGDAARIATLIGLSSIVGRISTGFLIDRFDAVRIATAVFVLPIIVIIVLAQLGATPVTATAAAIVLGLTLGGEVDILAFLGARFFGLRNFGVLFGTIGGLLSLSGGIGALLGGLVFDATGSYVALLWGLAPAFALSALAIRTIGGYPDLKAGGAPELVAAPPTRANS